jgi:solute carrier family 10 (sodium/bile acid cotransporter), member 7
VRVLRLGGTEPAARLKIQRALILVTSQKALPVAATVLAALSSVLGQQIGVAAIAMVMAHLSQILIDSALVDYWINQDQRRVPVDLKVA